MAKRPNFYDLLGLDPSVDDWEEIKKVLSKKRNGWMRDKTQLNQARREKAETGLKYLDEMKRVLLDDAARRKEAAEWQSELEARRKLKEDELGKWLEKIRSLGACGQEQFQMLVEEFDGIFTALEIERRLEAMGIHVGEAAPSETPARTRKEFISDEDAAEIQSFLAIFGQPSLYAFFDVDPGMSVDDLFKAADKCNKDSLKRGQSDDRANAERRLAGFGQKFFKDEASKARYDNYLNTLPMRDLHTDIGLAGAGKKIKRTDIDKLARQGTALGVSEEDASAYIFWYAEERKWEILEPTPEEVAKAAAEEAVRTAAQQAFKEEEKKREKERQEWRRRQEEMERELRRQQEAQQAAAQATSQPPPPPPQAGPLMPPAGLEVNRNGGGFNLRWTPVASPKGPVTYCVVRKADSPPMDEGDGDFVSDDLMTAHFTESHVAKGRFWYYGVYSVCGGEVSDHAAINGPHRVGGSRPWMMPVAAALLIAIVGGGYAFKSLYGPSGRTTPPAPPPGVSTPGAPSGNQQKDASNGNSQPSKDKAGKPSGPNPSSNVLSNHNQAGIAQVLPPSPPNVPLPPPPVVTPPPPPPTPPRPAANLPAKPRVAVVAAGDPVLAPKVERQMEQELRSRGLDVVSRGHLLRLDDLIRRRGGDVGTFDVLQVLAHEGVHVLVHAEIRHLGERELNYLGRTSIATTSSIDVDTFLVPGQRGIGSGWSEQFEYTNINLAQKVEGSVLAVISGVIRAVNEGWSSYRAENGLSP